MSNRAPIVFSLTDDQWTARIGRFEISITINTDGNERLDYVVYGNVINVPCESDGCPDEKLDRYDKDPDACAAACPFKTNEESIDQYESTWGENLSGIAKLFRENVLQGVDSLGHRTNWSSTAKKFAESDWILGAQRLTAP